MENKRKKGFSDVIKPIDSEVYSNSSQELNKKEMLWLRGSILQNEQNYM